MLGSGEGTQFMIRREDMKIVTNGLSQLVELGNQVGDQKTFWGGDWRPEALWIKAAVNVTFEMFSFLNSSFGLGSYYSSFIVIRCCEAASKTRAQ